ncbi:MAG: carboxypeptidase-like regulatory domain-containing protein, partial [Bacteroidota bacterium]
QKPVSNVNVRVYGTNSGTFTGQDGRFKLALKKIPASISLSCVGYETVYIDFVKMPSKPLALILRQNTVTLKEVDISARQYRYVYRDPEFSVLDYEIMDDNLLLLVFRNQLKRSELILLTLSGDTLNVISVPEQKPKCFFKDFLGYVHYISNKGNAYQCYYNDAVNHLGFIYKTTYDSLVRMVSPFLFSTGERFYFQEYTPDGFGTNIGYYDREHHKEYIRRYTGEVKRENYMNDMKFYQRCNENLEKVTSNIRGSENLHKPFFDEFDLRAHRQFNYSRINAPLVKLGQTNMAVFNFSENQIELMNQDGKLYKTVPITFHLEKDDNLVASLVGVIGASDGWKWGGRILVDEYYRNAYTTFRRNGMVRLRKIDLEKGILTSSVDLPFIFPEKIRVFKGDAYFLVKRDNTSDNWKLVKCKL